MQLETKQSTGMILKAIILLFTFHTTQEVKAQDKKVILVLTLTPNDQSKNVFLSSSKLSWLNMTSIIFLNLKYLYLFIFCLFQGCTCSIWRFSGQGSNQSCSHQPIPQPLPDPSRVCDLHHSSQQHQILNPLSEARDQTRNLIVPSPIH